ncbi:MAG: hypothetical protein ACRDTG_15850 [Pseudonocardiaceae bacterium]
MTSTAALRCGTTGRAVLLGPPVGPPGAEGRVYALSGQDGQVAKIYHRDRLAGSAGLEAKIAAMVAAPPADIQGPVGHWPLAWPLALLRDAGGAFVGFTMPAVQSSLAAKWHMLANPSDRDDPPASRSWTSRFDWRYRLLASANLADAVGSILDAGYVPGDLSGDNVFVYRTALITVIDVDSMQVPASGGGTYHCTVWRDEYLAPELKDQRGALDRTSRQPASTRYALAVLIYEMLMEGRHPFGGVWSGPGERPSRLSLSAKGCFVNGPNPRLTSGPGALDPAVLPPELRTLFDRAFVRGAAEPADRPSCPEWRRHLHQAAAAVRTCQRRSHPYPDHLGACPWCQRVTSVGKPRQRPSGEAPPQQAAAQRTPPPKPAQRTKPQPGWTSPAWTAPPAPPPVPAPPRGPTQAVPGFRHPHPASVSGPVAGVPSFAMDLVFLVGFVLLLLVAVVLVIGGVRAAIDYLRPDPATVGVFYEKIASNAPIGTCIPTKQAWEGDKGAISPVPCDQPHWGEILGYPRLTATPSSYPGKEQVDALTMFQCGLLFAERGLDSERYVHTRLRASREFWNEGAGQYENYATCVVYAHDDSLLPEQLVRTEQPPRPDASVRMTLFARHIGSNAPTGACVATRDSFDKSLYNVSVVPCERQHWAEILGYHVLYTPLLPYPGRAAVAVAADAACRSTFTARQLPPQFTYYAIEPGEEGWWLQSRPEENIYSTCLAFRIDNQEFAGPMQ